MKGQRLRVKAILLDLDGTLLDSTEAYEEALTAAMKSMGRETFEARLITEIPKRLEQGLPIEDLINGIKTRDFLAVYLDSFHRATVTRSKPVLNVANTLKEFSAKVKLAVITMRQVPDVDVENELKQHGLAEYIHHIVTALHTRNPKPSPEAILTCASTFGVKPSECAIVGDSISDIKAGKAAGAKTVAVLSGIYSSDELKRENPDLLLETVSQLADFVR